MNTSSIFIYSACNYQTAISWVYPSLGISIQLKVNCILFVGFMLDLIEFSQVSDEFELASIIIQVWQMERQKAFSCVRTLSVLPVLMPLLDFLPHLFLCCEFSCAWFYVSSCFTLFTYAQSYMSYLDSCLVCSSCIHGFISFCFARVICSLPV